MPRRHDGGLSRASVAGPSSEQWHRHSCSPVMNGGTSMPPGVSGVVLDVCVVSLVAVEELGPLEDGMEEPDGEVGTG
jgi:hypothetical protein